MLAHSYTPAAPSVQPISLPSVSLLTTALALAAEGIPVFPCRADKKPACAGGFKSASTDPATIRDLFDAGGELIGVPTGEVSGFDVVDVDPRNGGDAWWETTGQYLFPTLIHETRSGGKHLLFQHEPGVSCSTDRLAPGVDVRGDGGYIIHWPSAGCPVWLGEDVAPWPAGLRAGLARRPAQPAATVDAARLDPPSANAVVDLLNRLPNPLEVNRDEYARVMHAAAWCANVTGDEGGAIASAAVAWAERWEGGAAYDEAEKWESDWSRRTAPLAGWQTLQQVAGRLIPGYRAELAAAEFGTLPVLPVPALPAVARRRIIAPGQCEGATARPYRVKGLLADRDVGCLFGPPGAGKSLLAPLLAYKLAQGEPFFGLKTRQGTTLYVAAEDESGMERRVTALRLAHGDAPDFGLVAGVSDLLNPSSGDLAWLLAEVEARKPALIVIDTLAMAFPGIIENDADAMGRVVATARQLTAHGAAVLLVHHDSKARDGTPRGHSLLNGALDVAIALDPKDDSGIVRARLTKNRNGSCEADMAFRIGVQTLGVDSDGDPITAALAVELSAVETGKRSPALTTNEAAALGLLRDCMAGLSVTAADGLPAVPESTWLEACLPLSAADTAKDRARIMRRVRVRLVEKQAVHAIGGLFRPARHVPEFFSVVTSEETGLVH